MSRRIIKVTVRETWQPTDILVLYKGTENTASLAASTPVGGDPVSQVKVGSAPAGSVIAIAFDHRAADICGRLPVGVSCVNAAGNKSTVLEKVMQLEDPPDPPGRPDVTSTEAAGEALLTWLPSDDI